MFNGVTCLSCLITTATVWWTLKCQIECEALPRPNDWMRKFAVAWIRNASGAITSPSPSPHSPPRH
jgi:hypothetical protein